MLPSPVLKSPTRPTSIRTLCGAICSGASWVSSIGNGCCRLGAELNASVFSDSRSWPTPQSPELGDLLYALSSGNFLLFLP
jgi:hypothetical protein